MPNYLLKIQYAGTNFFGWQEQAKGRTVQDELQKALSKILGQGIKVTGGGRTDTGVHAFGQTANFTAPHSLEAFRFLHSLNAVLPEDISVTQLQQVTDDFSARFSATSRSYMYCITSRKSPFYNNYSLLLNKIPETSVLNGYASYLPGRHDFSSFTKNRKDIDHAFCEVTYASWKKRGDMLLFFIEANRFLHGMVRSLTGTMLQLATEKAPPRHMQTILDAKDRSQAGASVDAKGLFLMNINYPVISPGDLTHNERN